MQGSAHGRTQSGRPPVLRTLVHACAGTGTHGGRRLGVAAAEGCPRDGLVPLVGFEAPVPVLNSHGLCSHGLCSHGLYRYCLHGYARLRTCARAAGWKARVQDRQFATIVQTCVRTRVQRCACMAAHSQSDAWTWAWAWCSVRAWAKQKLTIAIEAVAV